mmetsp:Transcript_52634/g.118567  ORF Transcript_52634/g.118567 Transcript_52634/m.118567 type:complete len:240 (-) Transcript_52634:243-962(-)
MTLHEVLDGLQQVVHGLKATVRGGGRKNRFHRRVAATESLLQEPPAVVGCHHTVLLAVHDEHRDPLPATQLAGDPGLGRVRGPLPAELSQRRNVVVVVRDKQGAEFATIVHSDLRDAYEGRLQHESADTPAEDVSGVSRQSEGWAAPQGVPVEHDLRGRYALARDQELQGVYRSLIDAPDGRGAVLGARARPLVLHRAQAVSRVLYAKYVDRELGAQPPQVASAIAQVLSVGVEVQDCC